MIALRGENSNFNDYIGTRRVKIQTAFSEEIGVGIKLCPTSLIEIDDVLVPAMFRVNLHKVTNFKAQDLCKFYDGIVLREDLYYKTWITHMKDRDFSSQSN